MPRTQSKTAKLNLSSDTPPAVVDLITEQLELADKSRKRIADEGIVVRDMRGSVIPHPAIAIEAAATKLISDLLFKWRAL
ncbi:MAG: hypothetical protein GY715_14180 [Planctomycetes bacterium]|nr:hypothetical protein [Planctomycetota bacterium]